MEAPAAAVTRAPKANGGTSAPRVGGGADVEFADCRTDAWLRGAGPCRLLPWAVNCLVLHWGTRCSLGWTAWRISPRALDGQANWLVFLLANLLA